MHHVLEKHLLSLVQSGCYINTHEIVHIGNALKIYLAFKNRSLLLKNLFLEAHQKEKTLNLIEHLTQLMEDKKQKMLHLVTKYPLTHTIITPQIEKITATQQRLHQEMILHVKGA